MTTAGRDDFLLALHWCLKYSDIHFIAILYLNVIIADVVAEARKVWTLSANDVLDDDVELLDSDTLLDEDDFKKPDPTTLKGTVVLDLLYFNTVIF